jgi:carbon starvation protein
MLAAIALTLGTCVLVKMKRDRYVWVTLLPTVWLLICTLTAGWQKLFDPDPKIGFLAHANKYADAIAAGKLLAPAKSVAQMQQIVLNDRIDAALCGLRTVFKARAQSRPTVNETPYEALGAN